MHGRGNVQTSNHLGHRYRKAVQNKTLNFRYSGRPTPQSGVEVERKWKRADYQMPGNQKLVQIGNTIHGERNRHGDSRFAS